MIEEIVDIICVGIIIAGIAFLIGFYTNKPEEPATKTKVEQQAEGIFKLLMDRI